MNTHKVVVKIVDRKSSLKAGKPSRKGIGEPRKPTHIHSHGQVLSLNQTRGNEPLDGVSGNGDLLSADNTARRIAMLALSNIRGI